jgi:hypothetical protein
VLLGADFSDCHALAARVLPAVCDDDGTVTLQRCFSWLEREGESLLAATATAAEHDTVSDDSSSADAAAATDATAGATAGVSAAADNTASTQPAEQQQQQDQAVLQRIADAYAEINADSDSIAVTDIEALLKLLGVEDASSAAEGLRSADGSALRKQTFEGWYMRLQSRQQQQLSSAGSSVNSSFAEGEQQLSREGSAASSSADADVGQGDADATTSAATAAAAGADDSSIAEPSSSGDGDVDQMDADTASTTGTAATGTAAAGAGDSSTAEPSSAATTAGFLSPTRNNKSSSGGSSGFQFNAPPFSPPPARTPARTVPAAVPAVLASPGFSFGAGAEELRQVASAPWGGEDAISEDEDSDDEEEEADT